MVLFVPIVVIGGSFISSLIQNKVVPEVIDNTETKNVVNSSSLQKIVESKNIVVSKEDSPACIELKENINTLSDKLAGFKRDVYILKTNGLPNKVKPSINDLGPYNEYVSRLKSELGRLNSEIKENQLKIKALNDRLFNSCSEYK